jgi:hypothetical protein
MMDLTLASSSVVSGFWGAGSEHCGMRVINDFKFKLIESQRNSLIGQETTS